MVVGLWYSAMTNLYNLPKDFPLLYAMQLAVIWVVLWMLILKILKR